MTVRALASRARQSLLISIRITTRFAPHLDARFTADASVQRGGLLLAPLMGFVVGVVAAALLHLFRVVVGSGATDFLGIVTSLLGSAIAIAFLQLVAPRRAPRRVGDGGKEGTRGAQAFTVLVVFIQVVSLASTVGLGRTSFALIAAVATSRLMPIWWQTHMPGTAARDASGDAEGRPEVTLWTSAAATLIYTALVGLVLLEDDDPLRSHDLFMLLILPIALVTYALLRWTWRERDTASLPEQQRTAMEICITVILVAAALLT